jgi:hypothetical protein
MCELFSNYTSIRPDQTRTAYAYSRYSRCSLLNSSPCSESTAVPVSKASYRVFDKVVSRAVRIQTSAPLTVSTFSDFALGADHHIKNCHCYLVSHSLGYTLASMSRDSKLASQVCWNCKNGKRKCSKDLPACARCAKSGFPRSC